MNPNFRLVPAALLLLAWEHLLLGQNITSFDPVLGSPGDKVIISGSGFYTGIGSTVAVWFNGVQDPTAQATAANGTIIQAKVPTNATTGPISVSVNGGPPAFSVQDFTVIGPGPYVTNFSPYVGSAGTVVTVQGVHFTTANAVSFGGKPGTSLFVQNDNQLQVQAPTGVTNGPISVSSPQGSFVSSNFYVPPTLTGFSPTSGRANTNVILTGLNLSGATSVLFGGVSASFGTVTNNTTLQATVPVGTPTGPIRINTQAGSFTTTSNFVVRPTIFGFSPGAGPVGTSVTITGANFNVGTPTVRFNGTSSTSVSNISFGQLTATVPSGATTGPISITTTDGSHTNANNFYLPASITTFSPTNSAPGTTVTITGQNLLGTTNVSFNGASASFTPPVANTTLQAVVPSSVMTGPISVTTPAGTATSSRLFYGAPLITGFTPTHGLPGTNVTISGLNFLGATAVKFNGLSASFTPAANNTNIQTVVPANAQTAPITVVAPAGTNTSASSFVLDYTSDVAVSVATSPSLAFIGSNLVYTLTITNSGPFAAPNVALTNMLPSAVSLKSATTTQGTLVTNSNPILGSFNTVATNGSVTVTLVVVPQTIGQITNIAGVNSGYTDPVPGNNNVTTTTTVLPLPILSVLLQSANSVQLSWPVELTNFGLQSKPSLLSSLLWTDVLTPPVISSNSRVVVETNLAPAKFYRLKD
jgi:hypothetical protein